MGRRSKSEQTHDGIEMTGDARYKEQQAWIDEVVAGLGCTVFRPEYHGKAGDMNTVLAYFPEDARHNRKVDREPTRYSGRDEAKLHGCTQERYIYRPPFWSFANTDANGRLDLGCAKYGRLDLRGADWKDRIEGSVKLAYYSKLQGRYVRNAGGYLNLLEADSTQNDYNRDRIKAFRQAYGKAIMGRINPMKDGEPIFWEYTGGPIYNFACDFVLREEDAELRDLIQSWRGDLQLPKKYADADTVTSRVTDIGGELFIWR